MYAIASLFDPTARQATKQFWDMLEENCGLSGIKTTPYPHFSWLGTADLAWEPVKAKLEGFAHELFPFTVQTAGLGIFTGKSPIMYIPIVKTAALLNLHQKIWEEIVPFLVEPNNYYSPAHWVPHITLAYGDLTTENLPCAIEGIINQPLEFTIHIDNISMLFHTPEEIGVKQVFNLGR